MKMCYNPVVALFRRTTMTLRLKKGCTGLLATTILVTTCLAGQTNRPIGVLHRMRITSIRPFTPKARSQALSDTQPSVSYPTPPLLGFVPLVAIVTSDQHSGVDFDFEHKLVNWYTGNPLKGPAEENFLIGLLDTGSQVDMFFEPANLRVGVTESYLVSTPFPVGGVAGTIETQITMPIGIFAAGLAAIGPDGRLDLAQVVGHTNVCALVGPQSECEDQELTGVVGMPLLAFLNSQIRQDLHRRAVVGGEVYVGPDIRFIADPRDAEVKAIHKIPIQVGGLGPVTTASYFGFPDLQDPFGQIEPWTPTLLSMFGLSLPTGGAFYTDIGLLEGPPSPINPIQTARVMFDTGAQICIISPDVAARLSLPLEPDFTATICGIGGSVEAYGYFVDYVRINALGGPMEFANAPFLVLDIQGPDGGPLDGILGTNLLWNRNILIEPSTTGSGFIHVSGPVSYAYIDLNQDGAIDLADFAVLANAWGRMVDQDGYSPVCDLFYDMVIDYKDLSAFASSWKVRSAP
ncbi:MAG: aspartyl protease family protein [Sedimentisphaerales bacterium]|nr:aspartyl protease family protein [Sedimentisphaerales bacterium]